MKLIDPATPQMTPEQAKEARLKAWKRPKTAKERNQLRDDRVAAARGAMR